MPIQRQSQAKEEEEKRNRTANLSHWHTQKKKKNMSNTEQCNTIQYSTKKTEHEDYKSTHRSYFQMWNSTPLT